MRGDADPVEELLQAAIHLAQDGVNAVVIDTETGPVRLGVMSRLAEALRGSYHQLDAVKSSDVTALVSGSLGSE